VADQAWDDVTDLPLGTDQLQRDFCPSPQSNWYWIESPLGPVVEAVKVYVESGSPEEGPLGADGVTGAPVFCRRWHAGCIRATTKARTAVPASLERLIGMRPPVKIICRWKTVSGTPGPPVPRVFIKVGSGPVSIRRDDMRASVNVKPGIRFYHRIHRSPVRGWTADGWWPTANGSRLTVCGRGYSGICNLQS